MAALLKGLGLDADAATKRPAAEGSWRQQARPQPRITVSTVGIALCMLSLLQAQAQTSELLAQ
jgi:hypothetical protein